MRLDLACEQPPKPIREIALTAAARVVETLPIHPRLSAPDAPAVMANVQFLLVGLAHEFEAVDLAAVAKDFLKAA